MYVVSVQTAEHYVWGNRCDGWHLFRSAECSVIQERMPPHPAEVAHFHSRSRQFFDVLSARLSIVVEGAVQVLSPEDGLEVAPKIIHRVFNDTDSDVRFIVVSTPPSHGDRVIAASKMKKVNPKPAGEESEPRLPTDLRKALAATSMAKAQWRDLTPIARRDFISWMGVLAVFLGLGIIGWVCYNEFIERLPQYGGFHWWEPFGIGPALVTTGW